MCECTFDHPDPMKRLEIRARVVGFITPVNEWNKGKKAEYWNRKFFALNGGSFTTRKAKERRG